MTNKSFDVQFSINEVFQVQVAYDSGLTIEEILNQAKSKVAMLIENQLVSSDYKITEGVMREKQGSPKTPDAPPQEELTMPETNIVTRKLQINEKIQQLVIDKHSLDSRVVGRRYKELYKEATEVFGSWEKAVTHAGFLMKQKKQVQPKKKKRRL